MTQDNRRLSADEIETAIAALEGWELVDEKLYRAYSFRDFIGAMGFMVQVAMVAEVLNHHPDWSNRYRTVRVWLETHDVGGISSLDIELATKMNELAARSSRPDQ